MKDYKKVGIRVIYFKEQDVIMDSIGVDYDDPNLDWGA